ncbi:hypothetical protein UACE39S_00155 [Ureibacillus acetophenoni]
MLKNHWFLLSFFVLLTFYKKCTCIYFYKVVLFVYKLLNDCIKIQMLVIGGNTLWQTKK